jgi:hypothetical protein
MRRELETSYGKLRTYDYQSPRNQMETHSPYRGGSPLRKSLTESLSPTRVSPVKYLPQSFYAEPPAPVVERLDRVEQ